MKIQVQDRRLVEALSLICSDVSGAGGRALLVGGCVRDSMMGQAIKDLDIEVYRLAPSVLKELLERRFQLDLVGEAFSVLKLRGLPVDVSVPRRESKQGVGHRGFEVLSDPNLDISEAASRRDFTINAMLLDPMNGDLLDPCGGAEDLRQGVLRHVSGKFAEDPLRVLRGMQFAARLDFAVSPETVDLCRGITPEGLARERILEEWKKLIIQGRRPSRGLDFLRECGWIRWYPELSAMVGCAQEPEWHPEGDVWVHTLLCMDAYARARLGDAEEDLVVGLAVLCHDMGKPCTTKEEDGRMRSRGHSEAGGAVARSFLERLTNQQDLIKGVVSLVVDHMRPGDLHSSNAGDAAIRRLAVRVGRIDRLVRTARADREGSCRGDPADFPAGDWLLERARELEIRDSAPKPIVMGRHLLAMGMKPGPIFKRIIDACYEAQIEGAVTTLDEGLALAGRLAAENSTAAASGTGQPGAPVNTTGPR